MEKENNKNLYRIAFTLIELLVVIAIIGILSGLIVVAMGGMTQKATIAKAQVFSNSLRNSLMLNLVAEYKLDETSGTSINDSWGGHTAGTVSGAVIYSSCVQNTCYSFDGVDDYIELPDSSDLRMANGGTISVWIYPKSYGENGAGRIIDKSVDVAAANGYLFYVSTGASLGIYVNGNNYTMSSSNAFNQWQLATVTFNSSGRKIYVNGVDKTSTNSGTLSMLPPDVAGVVTIGNRSGTADRTFDGYIDEVRFFNVVIPTSQIKEQYYSGLNNLLASGRITKKEYIERMNQTKASIDIGS